MQTPRSLDRVWRMDSLVVAALGLAISAAAADAQRVSRVVAARDTLTVRSCAEASCRVVVELARGQSVEVLKTERGWHWVLVRLDGAHATTGWVDSATTTAAPPTVPTFSPLDGRRQVLPPRDGASASGATTTIDCLACVATRAATADEWSEALALTSGMKGRPALPAPPPDLAPAGATGPRPTDARAAAVRKDGRSTLERMRDELDTRFGEELTRLAEVAERIDPDLQTYLGVCYQKYMPIVVLPPGPTPPPQPASSRATIFDIWRGRPAYAWNETWSTQVLIGADSTAFCQGLWNDVSGRSTDVKAGIERVEAAARAADIYPGVVRDALLAYGLSDRR